MMKPNMAALLALGMATEMPAARGGTARPVRKTADAAKKRKRKANQKARRKQR